MYSGKHTLESGSIAASVFSASSLGIVVIEAGAALLACVAEGREMSLLGRVSLGGMFMDTSLFDPA